MRRLRRESKHGDTRMLHRLEAERVREVDVECDQAALLRSAGVQEGRVLGRTKALLDDRRHIVARILEERDAPRANVLVELQLQRVPAIGVSTYRSRDISAP